MATWWSILVELGAAFFVVAAGMEIQVDVPEWKIITS